MILHDEYCFKIMVIIKHENKFVVKFLAQISRREISDKLKHSEIYYTI